MTAQTTDVSHKIERTIEENKTVYDKHPEAYAQALIYSVQEGHANTTKILCIKAPNCTETAVAILPTHDERDTFVKKFTEMRNQSKQLTPDELNEGLLLTAKNGYTKSMAFFIEKGTDPNTTNSAGKTALDLYKKYCSENGKEPNEKTLDSLKPPEGEATGEPEHRGPGM